jgi:hypothetical protein
LTWTESDKGKFPLVYKTSTNARTKTKTNNLTVEQYKGKVWCFTVPTGLFITRRNGKITVQGNSGFANKDFKIFTTDGVDITRVGAGQGIYDTSADMTQLVKEIYVGLQVPPVMMDGGADTTYANGGVALDVLRQRYMAFRNMMSHWLKTKIFAPISKIQGFYDYSGGEKQLIVPEIDWNHMSLFDTADYISILAQTLTTGGPDQKRVSLQTLYRSMGLEYEDEVRKMRKENIQLAIVKKESAALEAMDLNALRSLDEEDEIPEPPSEEKAGEQPLPGETAGGGASPPGGGAMPDLSLPPPSGGGGAGPGAGAPPAMPAPSEPAPSAPTAGTPPTT